VIRHGAPPTSKAGFLIFLSAGEAAFAAEARGPGAADERGLRNF
jgi:hypothetical protein